MTIGLRQLCSRGARRAEITRMKALGRDVSVRNRPSHPADRPCGPPAQEAAARHQSDELGANLPRAFQRARHRPSADLQDADGPAGSSAPSPTASHTPALRGDPAGISTTFYESRRPPQNGPVRPHDHTPPSFHNTGAAARRGTARST